MEHVLVISSMISPRILIRGKGAYFAVLNHVLTKNQKEELGESWFNIDRPAF
jgi:hypothetical protein